MEKHAETSSGQVFDWKLMVATVAVAMTGIVAYEHHKLIKRIQANRVPVEQFMSRTLKGVKLSEYLHPEAVSVFQEKGSEVALVCGWARADAEPRPSQDPG